MRTKAAVSAMAVSVTLAAAPPALANGRFPASNAVVVTPEDPDFVLARVTFGLLVSRDRGRTWGWVCERAVGFVSTEDPTYLTRGDGSIAAGTFLGVRLSKDHACSWTRAAGVEKEVIVDLASTAPGAFLALASVYDHQTDAGGLLFHTTLFETHDFGDTFAPIGKALDPGLLGFTVEVAPSDASRVYVSAAAGVGEREPSGVVLASTDGGKTFVRTDLPLRTGERAPYIAALDPADARRVYVRTGGGPDAASRLLVSDDGAKHFRTAFVARGPLPGFALSPDGLTVWVGGPLDGLLVASTQDFVFTKTSPVQVQCLTATGDLVWVCSNEASGFFLATTRDGASFDVKLHLQSLPGVAACPEASSTTRECPKEWPALRRQLAIDDPPPTRAGGSAARARGDDTAAPRGWRTWALVAGAAVAIAFGARAWQRRGTR
jgi:hypothetical protein